MKTIQIYSIRIAMLCRLYELNLISDKEYIKIKRRLEKDSKKVDRKQSVL